MAFLNIPNFIFELETIYIFSIKIQINKRRKLVTKLVKVVTKNQNTN